MAAMADVAALLQQLIVENANMMATRRKQVKPNRMTCLAAEQRQSERSTPSNAASQPLLGPFNAELVTNDVPGENKDVYTVGAVLVYTRAIS